MSIMSIRIGYNLTKLCFFVFNIIFWILGCGCLGVGLWLYLSKNDYTALAPASYSALSAAGLCIAAGATVVVIGFVGCCGAWIESKCLLITYFVFVLVVFVIETTAGTLGFLYREEVSEVVRLEMYNHLNSPLMDPTLPHHHMLAQTWDRMQTRFSCCGVDNYTDWFDTSGWPGKSWVPDSCCDPLYFPEDQPPGEECGRQATWTRYFQQGCFPSFNAWLMEHLHVVGVMGILSALVQIFGLIASMVVYCGIREKELAYRR